VPVRDIVDCLGLLFNREYRGSEKRKDWGGGEEVR
jgi:hypothetical protein